MFGLIGKKKGMTQIFTETGDLIPVTVIEAGPCVVAQKKVKATDGYNALQLAYGATKANRLTKATRTHLEKKKLGLYRKLQEFRTEKAADFEVGDQFTVATFQPGDLVEVTGGTKG